jgi:hypothetical protein
MQTKLIDIPATQPSSALTSPQSSSETVVKPAKPSDDASLSLETQLLARQHLVATIDALGDCV